MEHDTPFVYQVQAEVVKYLKRELPHVIDIEYFLDGCAGQYKNFKNILNLFHHFVDFGITAKWSFFATSHGKSPCDGIGGTVKRLVARASLQRPLDDQILSMDKMFEYCEGSIKGVNFIKVRKKTWHLSGKCWLPGLKVERQFLAQEVTIIFHQFLKGKLLTRE
jgi:hypothetical protein